MSASDVTNTGNRVILNNKLDLAGAKEVVAAFGKNVEPEELKAAVDIFSRRGLFIASDAQVYTTETVDHLQGLLQTMETMNKRVAWDRPRFEVAEAARLEIGKVTKTFGGTEIPEAVKKLMATAKAAGATAYDVRNVEIPEWNKEHADFELPGVFTPYPQEIEARGSMSFGYTEITPEKIAKDMATVQHYKQINGYDEQRIDFPAADGGPQVIRVPRYKDVEGKGTGNITQHYDTSRHTEVYARGSSGQIWSNNCALLSDGSLHGLPAMRRSEFTGHILTNPSLARGQRLLGNFHLEMRGGFVTGIGISGRLQKLMNEGELKLVNPLEVLKAWGFKIHPDCRVRFEGDGPDPKIDPFTHVIG